MSAALRFEGAHVAYGGRPALSGVSASIARGAVTGVVGPNGAGKTTLLRAALGLLPLAAGEIAVEDRALRQWSRPALARAIAYLPQGGEAHWPLRAADLVMLGRIPHRARFAPPSDEDKKAVAEALARADAADFAERRIDELSAGERARALFARALATKAPILLADEPAAYLDPAHQLKLMALLKEEARRGTAVVVTLHDLSLASRLCDEILVLKDGRVAGRDLSEATLAKAFGITALRVVDPRTGAAALTPWEIRSS
ncbi:MAG TPA: ABC transporter ATP-binding protein [Rhizomicrobium sp.]|nr:ABC transporter ATP-binding protein [Rhizomicrobium sp.]